MLWLCQDESSGARAKVFSQRGQVDDEDEMSRSGGRGGGGRGRGRGRGRGGRGGGGRGGRGGRRRLDPLEEQMQRLSLGKRVPPNIVQGKDGMKELISFMPVNTKPKQVGEREPGRILEVGIDCLYDILLAIASLS